MARTLLGMSQRPHLRDLLSARLNRRQFLAASGAVSLPLALPKRTAPSWTPLAPSSENRVRVPDGFRADVLLRWGDPLFGDSQPFDARAQSASKQRRQFGTSADFTAFFPIGRDGQQGILCVNHEFTARKWMFLDADLKNPTRAQVEIELAAHGMSIVGLSRDRDGRWQPQIDHAANRRIHGETPIDIVGPAAGSSFLRTKGDPSGREVRGMLGNCGGGRTPWNTLLTCEENIDEYFGNAGSVADEATRADHLRFGCEAEGSIYHWEKQDARFDLREEPNELYRFGFVVEVDPFDPKSKPRKLTALGRFKHEAATVAFTRDRRVVVYMGDDEAGQFLYKFISKNALSPRSREANRQLLDEGTLYVARLEEDGTGTWLPLTPTGILEDWSLAEICVRTREAADLVGATPMDRAEDVEIHPLTRSVFVALTNHKKRAVEHPGNPRTPNLHGHVLEIDEAYGDHGSTRFTWDPLLLGGRGADGGWYGLAKVSDAEALSCPDNLLFDSTGDLWIATDGQPKTLSTNDALYRVATTGLDRGRPRRFLTAPVGAEVTGPSLSSDERTLFVCMQHPHGSPTVENPWPGTDPVPRSAVLAIEGADSVPVGR